MIKEHKPKNKRGVFVMSEKNLNAQREEAKRAILSLTEAEAREVLNILLEEKNKQDIPSIQATE